MENLEWGSRSKISQALKKTSIVIMLKRVLSFCLSHNHQMVTIVQMSWSFLVIFIFAV